MVDQASPLLYDPDFAFPKLRRTLAVATRDAASRGALPARPTPDAMDRMALAELELSALSLADRIVLARYRGSDPVAWSGACDCCDEPHDPEVDPGPDVGDLVRVERAARVAHLLLDDLAYHPERLEMK